MQATAFQFMKELLICPKYLKLGAGRDGLDRYVIGVIIIKHKDITIAAGGGYKKRAGLVCSNLACCFEAGGINMIRLDRMGLNSIVDVMRSCILTLS